MATSPGGRVVYRHSIATRVTHWFVTLAIVVLVMSGLQIFNAAPYLDASGVTNPAHRVLEMSAHRDPATGNPVGTTTLFGHTFTTTNVLGYADDGQGGTSPRGFAGYLTFPAYQDLAAGRHFHFFFGWVMLVFGAIYLVANLARKDLRLLILRPSDLPKLWPMQAYYLRLRREPPDHGKYNPLQKAGYTGLIFGLLPFSILTGLAMSPGIDAAWPWILPLLGGRQFARTWHFLSMSLVVAFVIGHVLLVLTTGFRNNMRSMTVGTYRLGDHEDTGA